MSTIGDVSGAAAVDLKSQVSVAVAKAAQDQAKQQGGEMVELIKSAGRVQEAARGSVSGVSPGELDVMA